MSFKSVFSKRAKLLVEKCLGPTKDEDEPRRAVVRKEARRKFADESPCPSFASSPAESWWSDIFSISDIQPYGPTKAIASSFGLNGQISQLATPEGTSAIVTSVRQMPELILPATGDRRDMLHDLSNGRDEASSSGLNAQMSESATPEGTSSIVTSIRQMPKLILPATGDRRDMLHNLSNGRGEASFSGLNAKMSELATPEGTSSIVVSVRQMPKLILPATGARRDMLDYLSNGRDGAARATSEKSSKRKLLFGEEESLQGSSPEEPEVVRGAASVVMPSLQSDDSDAETGDPESDGDEDYSDIPVYNGGRSTNDPTEMETNDPDDPSEPVDFGLNAGLVEEGSGLNAGLVEEGSSLNADLVEDGSGVNADFVEDGSGVNADFVEDGSGVNADFVEDGSGLNADFVEDGSGLNADFVEDGSGLNADFVENGSGLNADSLVENDSGLGAPDVVQIGAVTEPKKRKRGYTAPEKKTRKRLSYPKNRKAYINTQKLDWGEERQTKTKVIPARAVQKSCGLPCRFKCSSRVSEEMRRRIHVTFWKKLRTRARKREFISKNVDIIVKPSADNPQRKRASRHYYLTYKVGDETTRIKVCKTMFLATLDICDGWVDTTLKKIGEGGTLSPEKRGDVKQPRPFKISPKTMDSVEVHVNSLETCASHYDRGHTEKQYLTEQPKRYFKDQIRSVADLHRAYIEWFPLNYPVEENCPPVKPASERQYRDIFNTRFNIEFRGVLKDKCDACVQWDNLPQELKTPEREAEFHDHTLSADIALKLLQADTIVAKEKTNKTVCVACFDFEKALNCPQGGSSVFLYKRKITVSNLTIAEVQKNEGTCYVYDQTIGQRGSTEVASCLVHYTEKKVNDGFNDFRYYCDNCAGQNKNRIVTAALLQVAVKHNVKIRVNFLEKGHTYNRADGVHALIERNTRPYQIYTLDDWIQRIADAKRAKENKLKVVKVSQDMIADYHKLQGKLQLEHDVNRVPIRWTKVRQLEMNGNTPFELRFREQFQGNFSVANIRKVGHPVNFQTYSPEKMYTGPIPVSHEKYNDVISLCRSFHIPPEHHHYYEALTRKPPQPKKNAVKPLKAQACTAPAC